MTDYCHTDMIVLLKAKKERGGQMGQMIERNGLKIDETLYQFVKDEALAGLDMSAEQFWGGFEKIIEKLAPKNKECLLIRDKLQQQLDSWYLSKKEILWTQEEHQNFLYEIGYLEPRCEAFKMNTQNIDPEIAKIAGPQLVVPADNARYALNAANARWGSLFDALYGTDMITNMPPYEKKASYNERRGEKVFDFAFDFLDETIPLEQGTYSMVTGLYVQNKQLRFTLNSNEKVGLKDPSVFVAYLKADEKLTHAVVKHNGLHIEMVIDPLDLIGSKNAMGLKDLIIESAISTIQDCEDSVAAVDAEDKVNIYRNWLGMMRGDLQTSFENKGKTIHRALNLDKHFLDPNGKPITLKGRTLLLVRNVGMHIYTDTVTTFDGAMIPENFLDALVTTLCAMHDLKKSEGIRNSTMGSIYIVKPKCHGKDEITLSAELFSMIEAVLNLPTNTIKIGIMDEERRMSVNLKEAIKEAKERVFFINTGFLDRTGDEIHSCMELGAVLPKEEIKKEPWLVGYENQNVDIGLEVGFRGHAQIGKGMWTMPDHMQAMMKTKINHPLAGANTAWVPSPTAATLHALHYHKVDVFAVQEALSKRKKATLDAILTPPLLKRTLSKETITKELENNIQSILGYVVRWVDQGIGCSKVPDINDVALMEDRATLRISSQHIANWLHHDITNKAEVREIFEKMAGVVDLQNDHDENYQNMSPDFEKSIAFQAALDLVFKGRNEPNGYTEFILHRRRREAKSMKG